ncbi:MAG: hypothetical protein GVY30_11360 [Chloroflexi bacterium]|jgi:hypothetical protein|nr:hypothetical protein [Chloroflexota bacterium]
MWSSPRIREALSHLIRPAREAHLAPASLVGLFFISAATLLLEITLTRLFSVAQFYHFAFMIISLGMLGFGASGTWLALFPRWGRARPRRTLALLALAYGVTSVGAYALTNVIPFDSFSIAWERRQVAILALHYVALAAPFFCSGAMLGLLFAQHPKAVSHLYALNFGGSAVGCALALLVPTWLGGAGVILLCGALGGVAALCFAKARTMRIAAGLLIIAMGIAGATQPAPLTLELSPYKGLSHALRLPDARVVFRAWNSFSRVDVVASESIRSLAGLSYQSPAAPPPQHGVYVDGGDPSPALQLPPATLNATDALTFTDFMPTTIAYQLRPGGEALVLAPHGGLALWIALAQGAGRVTAVEPNPLIIEGAGRIYDHPRVTPEIETPRSYVRRTEAKFDVVELALTSPYHPVRSGAYSLAEDYAYTVEAFRDDLAALRPDGLLVVTRWLQMPPSESLRAFALAMTAVEAEGGDPTAQIIAFRGYQTLTLLVKRQPFTEAEVDAVRDFTARLAFDLVIAPGMDASEANRYNVLERPLYHESFTALRRAEDRAAWYAAYAFDVTPPTDQHPFFWHFFKWSQAPEMIATLGKQWQPFGGAGYFVLLLLLALTFVAATALILLPAILFPQCCGRPPGRATTGTAGTPARARTYDRLPVALYFGLLGLGFLCVEIPLMQRFILFLGHPAYAMTAVLFAVLLFSGIGSLLSSRAPLRPALALLIALALVYPLLLPRLFAVSLGLPLSGRMLVTVASIAPLGLLMGMPFPKGLGLLESRASGRPASEDWIPWAWGVNGATSVVASVLASLVALTWGFRWVLALGALCYAGAYLVVGTLRRGGKPHHH